MALTDRRLTPGFHFLAFSSFRSCWLEEEVEGPWGAESRGLTPRQQNRASCRQTDGMFCEACARPRPCPPAPPWLSWGGWQERGRQVAPFGRGLVREEGWRPVGLSL